MWRHHLPKKTPRKRKKKGFHPRILLRSCHCIVCTALVPPSKPAAQVNSVYALALLLSTPASNHGTAKQASPTPFPPPPLGTGEGIKQLGGEPKRCVAARACLPTTPPTHWKLPWHGIPPPLTFRKAVTECKQVWSISVAACTSVEKSDAGIGRC